MATYLYLLTLHSYKIDMHLLLNLKISTDYKYTDNDRKPFIFYDYVTITYH